MIYTDMENKTQDEQRLFDLLMAGIPEFCTSISWLGEKALASQDENRFQEMWSVYYSVMTKVGRILFDSDIHWNTNSEQIEPVLDLLLKEGYSEKIFQLMLGAANLFTQTKCTEYGYKSIRLREIATQYYGIIRQYERGGVLTCEDRNVKWDFIDHSNRFFGAAYDIIENACTIPEDTSMSDYERREAEREAISERVDEISEGRDHPFLYRIKKFFRLLAKWKKRRQ